MREAWPLCRNVVKLGFIGAVRYGNGVVLVRDASGAWGPPQLVTLTGGSVGWQAGIQATDVVLVFKTPKSIEGLMRGKFTLGADAAVAAGPVGRQAAAATDAQLQAEIYSFSKTRGLFAGVSLDGSAIQVDAGANARYYYPALSPASQLGKLPQSAVALMSRLTQYTSAADSYMLFPSDYAAAQRADPVGRAAYIRQLLADHSRRLQQLLDDRWRQYLAMPSELFAPDRPLPAETVRPLLSRFDAVALDPQYLVLTQRPEFQSTHQLLRECASGAAPGDGRLSNLPPPPSAGPAKPEPVLR